MNNSIIFFAGLQNTHAFQELKYFEILENLRIT